MWPPNPKISTFTTLLMVALMAAALPAAGANHEEFYADNSTTATSSPWLRKHAKPPRGEGCRGCPCVCRDRGPPFRRRLCCRDRCIRVGYDENNCGFCGIRCPFSWRCCSGFCVDTNLNPFHCGGCFNRCPLGVLCFHGMCGYAMPHPHFPFRPAAAEASRRAEQLSKPKLP